MQDQSPDINSKTITALHRLARAGGEHSRTTQKLKEAAAELAYFIAEELEGIPCGVRLPRNYIVIAVKPNANIGTWYYLATADKYGDAVGYLNGTGEYLAGDVTCWVPACTRKAALKFAADIASGWLDELADWLASRSAKDAQATDQLEATIARLRGSDA